MPSKLRQLFPERTPRNGGDEKAWIQAYVLTRHNWLLNHGKKLLRKTVYRTQCFLDQINTDNWDLKKAVMANNVRVDV